MNRVLYKKNTSVFGIRLNSKSVKRNIATMTQGKAIATVQGRKIAETDEYEIVEGNVYVRFLRILGITSD